MRWLWGAFEQLQQRLLADRPADAWQQVDTTARPVEHPSRVCGPDAWAGRGDLRAEFGWYTAHRDWSHGFRPGLRTALGSRLVRTWDIVPALIDERAVTDDLLAGPRRSPTVLIHTDMDITKTPSPAPLIGCRRRGKSGGF